VGDGAPWLIGQGGHGNFYLGDRIAVAPLGGPKGKLYVDRVSQVTYAFDHDKGPGWELTVGQREQQDPVAKSLEMVKELFGIAKDLGVL
jgi:hypothetical protein